MTLSPPKLCHIVIFYTFHNLCQCEAVRRIKESFSMLFLIALSKISLMLQTHKYMCLVSINTIYRNIIFRAMCFLFIITLAFTLCHVEWHTSSQVYTHIHSYCLQNFYFNAPQYCLLLDDGLRKGVSVSIHCLWRQQKNLKYKEFVWEDLFWCNQLIIR